MFFDTHCHLSKQYYDDIDSIIAKNKERGVERIIISGCELSEIEESLYYAKKYNDVYLSLGFHPSEVDKIENSHFKMLENFLGEEKVVALGEIGLDYHYGKENRLEQMKLFEKQLNIAEAMNLPVIVHSRDATQDTIDILKNHHVKGVIHCFSGSYEIAKQYIDMGFLLGIGGVVTFKNSNLPKVISMLDLSCVVLETDSPYLTPHPYRGQVNSSQYIPVIALKIAEVKGVSVDDVMRQTTANAIALFDF